MTLYLIGLGLNDEKDISLRGLEAVKACDKVFLEGYTSKLNCGMKELKKLYGKQIIFADRNLVEKKAEQELIAPAKDNNIALLVIGDPMSATTHTDILLRAKKAGINTQVIHNTSVMTAVGIVGLELYKFGRTTSIPFPEQGFEPETPYDVIKDNNKLHTLLLLDLRPDKNKYMTINQAIKYLLKIEDRRKENVFTEDMFCIGCARLGSDYTIKAGKAKELLKQDFGKPVHCLIVPGKLHFIEEEALERWMSSKQ